MGRGGSSNTSSATTNYSYSNSYNSSISDFLGTNNSVLNLGAGSSSYTTRELTQQFESATTNRNDNLADLTGAAGGGGGGFGLDVGASVGVSTGSGNASGGQVDKSGGASFEGLGSNTAYAPAPVKSSNNMWIWILAGGGALVALLLIMWRR